MADPLRFWPRFGLSTLTAVFIVLAFRPYSLFPLVLVSMVPLMALAMRIRLRRALLWGWWSGTFITAVGFYFIYELLIVFGGLPAIAAAPVHLLFGMLQGIQMGFFAVAFAFLTRRTGLPAIAAAPLAYVPVELFCSGFFIFPWYLGSSSHPFRAFVQVADLFGGFGLTAIIMAVNGALYSLVEVLWARRKGTPKPLPRKSLAIAAGIFAVTCVYGVVRIGQVDAVVAEAQTLRVGTVEADIGIFQKAEPEQVRDNMLIHQGYSEALAQQGAELIVWPETAVNTWAWALSRAETDDLGELQRSMELLQGHLPRDVTWFRPSDEPLVASVPQDRAPLVDRLAIQRGFDTPLLFGVLTARWPEPVEQGRYPPHPYAGERIAFNTAMLIDSDGRVLGTYDKNVLLPFGEFVPLSGWLFRSFGVNFFEWIPSAGNIHAGEGVSVMELPLERLGPDGQPLVVRIGPMICYEDIISDYGLALAAQRPNMFINIINDGWFEDSSAAYHHMDFAVLRSVEHRLPLVRATNTGISSFIDPVGRIIEETHLDDPETMLLDVPIMPPPSTLYSRIGDLIAYLMAVAYLGLAIFRRRSTPVF